MGQFKLNPEIVDYLSKKLGKAPKTIEKDISLMKRKYGTCTSNAVSHLYATQYGFSVIGKLSKDDKATLPHIDLDKKKVKLEKKDLKKKEVIIKVIEFDSTDYFIKGHISEVNRAYTKGCYTSVYVLTRKIIENLIIDILRNKYPPNTIANKQLYYDLSQRRYLDFSVVLKNIYDKRYDFSVGKEKIIERLYQKAKYLKDDANDKAHSWFHLVKTRKEIDDLDLQTIFELLKKLM